MRVELVDNGTVVFTLKYVGRNSNWQLNDGGSDFSSRQSFSPGTSTNFTFTYEGSNDYSYDFGNGSGSNFTANNPINN
jgi:hypothetical protein